MTPGAALWSGREACHSHAAAALLECCYQKESMMPTKEERLKALEQKQAQIKARIQALKARDTSKERKADTRRKVLLGSYLQDMMRRDGFGPQVLSVGGHSFDAYLTRDQDRALFGLAAKPALSPAAPSGGAVSNGG